MTTHRVVSIYTDNPVQMLHLRQQELRNAQKVLRNCRCWPSLYGETQNAREIEWASKRVCKELDALWRAQEAVREWLRYPPCECPQCLALPGGQ